MPNYFNIPLCSPLKFAANNGNSFDASWHLKQKQWFEIPAHYIQKWQKTDTTKLQIESTIAPQPLKVYNTKAQVVKSINWQPVFSYINYAIYELVFDVTDLPNGIYFCYQKISLLDTVWELYANPLDVADSWPNTMLFTYSNSFNDFGVAFSTGIEFSFRCEACIPPTDTTFENAITTSINQQQAVTTVKSVPYRTYKLHVGETPYCLGVAPYMVDIVNRIFGFDKVQIDGLPVQRQDGAKIEVQRAIGYPLITATLDVSDAKSIDTIGANTELAKGIVTAYNIETGFFGPGTIVPITDIEKNG